MPLGTTKTTILFDLYLAQLEPSQQGMSEVVEMLLSRQDPEVNEALEIINTLIFDSGDNSKLFALRCILKVYESNDADDSRKKKVLEMLLKFFLHCYDYSSYDLAVMQIVKLIDDFPEVGFVTRAAVILDFVVMLQNTSSPRLTGLIQRLGVSQLDKACAMVAYAAVQKKNIDVKALLAAFFQQSFFLGATLKETPAEVRSGLGSLQQIPDSVDVNDVSSCIARLNILTVFLRRVENKNNRDQNQEAILSCVVRIVGNFPQPIEMSEKERLYIALNDFLETYRQYYDPDKDKCESDTEHLTEYVIQNFTNIKSTVAAEPKTAVAKQAATRLSLTVNKTVAEKINDIIQALQRMKATFGLETGKDVWVDLFSVENTKLSDEVRNLIREFWSVNTTNARINIIIQVYQYCLTGHNDDLALFCANYLLVTVGWKKELLTDEFLKRQRLLYGIGHQYQGQQMLYMAPILEWLDTIVLNEALENESMQNQLRVEYRNRFVSALEQAVQDGEILLLSDAKIRQEQLRCMSLKSKKGKFALDLPQVVQCQIYQKKHSQFTGKVLSGDINELNSKHQGELGQIADELRNDVMHIRHQKAYLDFITAWLASDTNQMQSIVLPNDKDASEPEFIENLEYLLDDDSKRMAYQVFVTSTGMFCKFDDKACRFIRASTKSYTTYNKVGWAAFVITTYGEILVNTHGDLNFNHASFVAGAPVMFSGELCIGDEGYVTGITTLSGHYLTQLESLRLLKSYFLRVGVMLERCIFYVFDKRRLEEYDAINEDKQIDMPRSTSSGIGSPQKAVRNRDMLDLCHKHADIRELEELPDSFHKIHSEVKYLITYITIMLTNMMLLNEGLKKSLIQLKSSCHRVLLMKNLSEVIAVLKESVATVISCAHNSRNYIVVKICADMIAVKKNLEHIDFVECLPQFVKPNEPFLFCQQQLLKYSKKLEKGLQERLGELFFLILPRSANEKQQDLSAFVFIVNELERKLKAVKKPQQFFSQVVSIVISDSGIPPQNSLRKAAEKVSETVLTADQFSLFKKNILHILHIMRILCEFDFQSEGYSYFYNFNAENLRQLLFYRCWNFFIEPETKPTDLPVIHESMGSLFVILHQEHESLEQFVLALYQWISKTSVKNAELIANINAGVRECFPDCKDLSEALQQLLQLPQYLVLKQTSIFFVADTGKFNDLSELSQSNTVSSKKQIVADAMRNRIKQIAPASIPAFIVYGGNNFYPSGVSEMTDVCFTELSSINRGLPPVFAVMGNHDHNKPAFPLVMHDSEGSGRFGFFSNLKKSYKTTSKQISACQVEYTMNLKPVTQNKGDKLDGRAFYSCSSINLDYLTRNGWAFNMPKHFYSMETNDSVLLFLDSNVIVKDFLKFKLKQNYVRKNPASKKSLVVDKVNNQFFWLLHYLGDLSARGVHKPKILIWHHPLYPFSEGFVSIDTSHFLQSRHLEMLKLFGIDKIGYHEILREVLLVLKQELKLANDVALFSAVFSGHEHVNSVVHNSNDPVASLHCTFGAGGGNLHKRERFERNTFFYGLDNSHAVKSKAGTGSKKLPSHPYGFAHITVNEGDVNVQFHSVAGMSYSFSSREGLLLNELPDLDIKKFRQAIIEACDAYADKLSALTEIEMPRSDKQIKFDCIDIVKRYFARDMMPGITLQVLAEELLTINMRGHVDLQQYSSLFGFINRKIIEKVLTSQELNIFNGYIKNIKKTSYEALGDEHQKDAYEYIVNVIIATRPKFTADRRNRRSRSLDGMRAETSQPKAAEQEAAQQSFSMAPT